MKTNSSKKERFALIHIIDSLLIRTLVKVYFVFSLTSAETSLKIIKIKEIGTELCKSIKTIFIKFKNITHRP